MENLRLAIRKYDWFEIFRESLDEDNLKALGALAIQVNEHWASIAVAGHPSPNYAVMLSFLLEEDEYQNMLQREIAQLPQHAAKRVSQSLPEGAQTTNQLADWVAAARICPWPE